MKYDVLEVPSKEATEYLKVDDECKQYYDKLNKETNGEVLVDAETGDQIGHAFVYNSGSNKGFIFNIQVNPRYCGYGFGKKLLDDCVKKYGYCLPNVCSFVKNCADVPFSVVSYIILIVI